MSDFIQCLELSRLFYWEVVRPILDQHYPGLLHAAGLIGPGSEILGFDTQMSMDHHWFPKVQIFLEQRQKDLGPRIYETLKWNLPATFMDFPLNLEESADEPGIMFMAHKDNPPFEHGVRPISLQDFEEEYLGWEDGVTSLDRWLSTPTQILRSTTGGAVHFDNVGELTTLRKQLEWYPRDVWLYLLASGWYRIGDEEHLMPRAGYIGDELGSALIGSMLIKDIMALCFLMEKQYAPYPKWFGTAFQQLECADMLLPVLRESQLAKTWQEREEILSGAYHILAEMHNGLGITSPLPTNVSKFHSRPFNVIHGDRFGDHILSEIKDPQVLRLSRFTLSGGIDQISDNTKFLSKPETRRVFRQFYLNNEIH